MKAVLAQLVEHRTCNAEVVGSTPTGSTITAHQNVYLPWCGFFEKVSRADRFVIFDCVQFERHGYSNRVQIKTHQGAQWLTVPVDHGKPLLRDATITDNGWGRKHLGTIKSAYQKAPYFNDYYGIFEEILTRKWQWLADLDDCLLEYLFHLLDMKVEFSHATAYDLEGEKSDLVLDLCLKLGAQKYIFGAKGKDYADVKSFEDAGVNVAFQDYHHPVYPQLHGEFIPGLSVIDLLFNCGEKSMEIIKSGNDLSR